MVLQVPGGTLHILVTRQAPFPTPQSGGHDQMDQGLNWLGTTRRDEVQFEEIVVIFVLIAVLTVR